MYSSVLLVITLRNSEKARAREIIYSRYQTNKLEYYQALNTVFTMTGFETYEEFNKKYGRYTNPEAFANFLYVGWVFNNAGVLFQDKLADSKQILTVYNPTTIVNFWDKFGVWVMGFREQTNYTEYWKPLESLYGEVKRLYPDLDASKISEYGGEPQ